MAGRCAWNKVLMASRLKGSYPPVNQWGFPQQLADHPHPVVGVLQAAGPAGDGQVDGQHDDKHQQADQQEQPVLATELHAWKQQNVSPAAKGQFPIFTHFLWRLAL